MFPGPHQSTGRSTLYIPAREITIPKRSLKSARCNSREGQMSRHPNDYITSRGTHQMDIEGIKRHHQFQDLHPEPTEKEIRLKRNVKVNGLRNGICPCHSLSTEIVNGGAGHSGDDVTTFGIKFKRERWGQEDAGRRRTDTYNLMLVQGHVILPRVLFITCTLWSLPQVQCPCIFFLNHLFPQFSLCCTPISKFLFQDKLLWQPL